MPNYRQSSVSGERYQRCVRIDLQNVLGGVPTAIFFEEEVITIGDERVVRPLGHMQVSMTDPAATFPMLNPTTDAEIGTGTHGQVYALMYSLYRAVANARDNPPQEPPPEEPPA